MFKKTNPQRKLFGVLSNLGRGLRSRLTPSWAEVFREEVLPILLRSEDKFSILYDIIGRPNFSVGRILGILVLQAWHNLSDQDALDAFGFDLRWRYALDVFPRELTFIKTMPFQQFDKPRLFCPQGFEQFQTLFR